MALELPLQKFYHWEQSTPNEVFFRQPLNGQWMEYSYQQAGSEIRRIAAGLQSLNLPPNSKIALLSKNCAHWIMADIAIWMSGHVAVPLYPTITANTIKQILEHSETSAIFVGKLDTYDEQRAGIPANIKKISFPYYGINEGILWNDWLAQHQPLPENVLRDGNDLMTIAYTSGTTGMPKGAMISFSNFAFAVTVALDNLERNVAKLDKPRLFSYLPLSHVAERMVVQLTAIYRGGAISFAETLDSFGKNLAESKPHLFFGVPRIWAKFQEKILEKMPQKKLSTLLKIPILNGIVKKKIQKALGLDEAKICISAAAPIPVELLQWFQSLGITIREVYGMTENCAVSHANLEKIKIGSVGHPHRGIEVRISEEGEVQTRHGANMVGYYKEPTMTAEMFTADGWLKTGDQGVVDSEGYLTITGRIKDLFKTDKGKYVAPSPIEMKLLTNTDIEQVCVVGMGIPQPIALTVLSESGKKKSKEEIVASLSVAMQEINPALEHHERLMKAVIMKDAWTIENGLMTPTLKVKRNEVEKIHLPKYPMWYQKEGSVVWE
jgi:long-chain acyl-CoA synthetase